MAVLATIQVQGMSKETYDQSTDQLIPLVKQQPGFILHAAYPSGAGYTIVEVWESEEAANTWYNGVVRPAAQQVNIPPFEPDFQELSNVATP